jgi:hypothetical protein
MDDFDNYNYDALCHELLNLRKESIESICVLFIIYKHIIFKFHIQDIPPIYDFLSQLLALYNEKN